MRREKKRDPRFQKKRRKKMGAFKRGKVSLGATQKDVKKYENYFGYIKRGAQKLLR